MQIDTFNIFEAEMDPNQTFIYTVHAKTYLIQDKSWPDC